MTLNINNIDEKQWVTFLNNSLYPSPFQTPEFYKFYNSLTGFSADVFAIYDKSEIVALCVVTIQKEPGVKSYFSRRGIIYGGPVLKDNNGSLDVLLSSITDYYNKKLIFIEIRNYFDYKGFYLSFDKNEFEFIPWLNFHLEIDDIAAVNKRMSSSRLRQIKKAIKNGAEWREAKSVDEVKEFYEILKNLYKNKIKKPLFSIEFFIEFFYSNSGKYLLIHYNDIIIGGIMCPIMPDKAIYEYYVCGLDTQYKDQYPSVMATWAAIEYASQNDITLFDFMGAGSPSQEYGVREFKSRFGGIQVEHGRYLKILNPFLYKVGILGLKILAKIK